MPSSIPDHIVAVLQKAQEVRPRTVLDVGAGFGKWGFLLREYLEAFRGNVFPGDWRVKIDAVEVFAPYANLPWFSCLYSKVYLRDIHDLLPELPRYDLIIAGDVIEHLPKSEATATLRGLREKTDCLIVSIPLGEGWLGNKTVAGNPFEQHRSWWTKAELTALLGEPASYREAVAARGPVALAVWA